MRALNRLDWLPYLGFVVPPLLMIATNGFQIYEWKKGEPFPEPWFVWIIFFTNVLVSLLVLVGYSPKQRYNRLVKSHALEGYLAYLKATYLLNTDEVWNLFYWLRFLGLLGVACIYFNFSWGVSFIIYFVIGRL